MGASSQVARLTRLRPPGANASRLDERIARIEELTAHLSHQLDLQFKRIAQLQAEIDEMRAASANIKEFHRGSSS